MWSASSEPFELASSLLFACCSNIPLGNAAERAKECLRQKTYADRGCDASYQVGDKLLLNAKHIRLASHDAPKADAKMGWAVE